MSDALRASLCAPRPGLSCFACCPPIRPAGYDHLDHRPSLHRLLGENTAAFLSGRPPAHSPGGRFCSGLGFLEPEGRSVGCLLHPARNQGRDLRVGTGWQQKCAREICLPARAFAALTPVQAEVLLDLCTAMDSFEFSSRWANPVMRLLDFGPQVAGAAASLHPKDLGELAGWSWLQEVEPALGWLLARLLAKQGSRVLVAPEMTARLKKLQQGLTRALGPAPPLEQGRPLADSADDIWEARLWRRLSGRRRAHPSRLAAWRSALEGLIA